MTDIKQGTYSFLGRNPHEFRIKMRQLALGGNAFEIFLMEHQIHITHPKQVVEALISFKQERRDQEAARIALLPKEVRQTHEAYKAFQRATAKRHSKENLEKSDLANGFDHAARLQRDEQNKRERSNRGAYWRAQDMKPKAKNKPKKPEAFFSRRQHAHS